MSKYKVHLDNPLNFWTLLEVPLLSLGTGRRRDFQCEAETSVDCTAYMELGQLERTNQEDRGLTKQQKTKAERYLKVIFLLITMLGEYSCLKYM